jgi:hypothetical protein
MPTTPPAPPAPNPSISGSRSNIFPLLCTELRITLPPRPVRKRMKVRVLLQRAFRARIQDSTDPNLPLSEGRSPRQRSATGEVQHTLSRTNTTRLVAVHGGHKAPFGRRFLSILPHSSINFFRNVRFLFKCHSRLIASSRESCRSAYSRNHTRPRVDRAPVPALCRAIRRSRSLVHPTYVRYPSRPQLPRT